MTKTNLDTNMDANLAADSETQKVGPTRRQRMRSWAIAGGLLLLVALFYAATLIRLGGAVADRSL